MVREFLANNQPIEKKHNALILSKKEWESPPYSLLPIYFFIQEEGVAI